MPDRYLGRTIGKYRVTRYVGAGAFSWVYEAVDLDLEIPVALKILRPPFSDQTDARDRFRREASTAARLRHRHIVTVRDLGQVDGAPFVAMDLYPLTLGHRLMLVGHLPEAEVVRLGIGIAAALAVAHANQVIHRDIKPDNILLDQTGEAVVADFGLARALAVATAPGDTNRIQGTPHYFSPEQARGRDLDGRSDLYSLGITLYRAATGRLPFEGDDWYAVARQHVETPPPAPRGAAPDLTPEFEAVLLRLLAKRPADRFASAVHLVDALGALPTAPAPTSGVPRLEASTLDAFRGTTSKPSRVWLTAAVLLIGGLIGWILWDRRPRAPVTTPRAVASAPVDTPLGLTPGRTPRITPTRPAAPVETAHPGADTAPTRREPVRPPRTVRLEIFATDSATIYVDNRPVGVARWSGERPPTSRLDVRAVVPDASTACRTALRDTVLTGLEAGQRRHIDLIVRGCTVVRFRVEPRDARVQFAPLDGGDTYETRADSVLSYLLPRGRYLMRISAPYCIVFSDTVVVTRAPGDAIIPRTLVCR